MKCKNCFKVIPDGFTDCPWCGAAQAAPVVSPSVTISASEPFISPVQNLLVGISLLTSGALFGALNYFAMVRTEGSLTLANSGYFLGRCAGSLLLAALLAFGYWKIRGRKPRAPVQVLVIFTVSSLLTLLVLAIPARSHAIRSHQETFNQFEDDFKNVKDASKWSAANRSLMKDLISRNQQYVSEISKLDETSKPLYTPQSFRDPATVQQMIDQLQARLAVADKYVDLEPVLSRMNGYVAAIDASDQEKRDFMKGFASTVPATRAAHKALTDKEHAWLQASLDLYQFALSKASAYILQNEALLFKQRKDSEAFGQKLHNAQKLNVEFLRAYWGARQEQQAMLAQLGSQTPATDSSPSPHP